MEETWKWNSWVTTSQTTLSESQTRNDRKWAYFEVSWGDFSEGWMPCVIKGCAAIGWGCDIFLEKWTWSGIFEMKIKAYILCYGLILKPYSSSLIWHKTRFFHWCWLILQLIKLTNLQGGGCADTDVRTRYQRKSMGKTQKQSQNSIYKLEACRLCYWMEGTCHRFQEKLILIMLMIMNMVIFVHGFCIWWITICGGSHFVSSLSQNFRTLFS